MNIKNLGIAALIILSLTGCSIDKTQYADYLKMQGDYNSINYDYKTDYTETIAFLANYTEIPKGKLSTELTKYSANLTQSAIDKIENSLQDTKVYETTPITHADPADIGAPKGSKATPTQYPIYGAHMAIERYGTHDEYLAALKELKDMPTNSVISLDKYKDYIVASMDNKNTGEFLMTFTLKDGKIDSYTTYWR